MTIGFDSQPVEQWPAGADLSAKQYHFVKLNTSGQVVSCDAAGEMPYGILQNKPDAAGEIADVVVMPGTRTKLMVGGSVAVGDKLKTNASGRGAAISLGVVNTSDGGAAGDPVIGSYVAAIVTEKVGTTADGSVVQVKFLQSGVAPTTAA